MRPLIIFILFLVCLGLAFIGVGAQIEYMTKRREKVEQLDRIEAKLDTLLEKETR